MRRDAPLAEKASVAPGDLLEKPLILTDQPDDAQLLTHWLSPAGGAGMSSPPTTWSTTLRCWWTKASATRSAWTG